MTEPDTSWLVGCGSADVTGEPWDAGMMGYGLRGQRTAGIHLRQHARAFVVADRASGRRVAYVVADIAMFFANVREAVLARLQPYGLAPEDVLLTATHTHAGPGGTSCYRMYGTTNGGLRRHTFAALVDGVVESVERALADLAPGRVVLARGELTGASVNRSPDAFARNPEADRRHFPGAVDPAVTVLRLERGGRLVGAVQWFATHGTSLSNRNRLISGDNKGYAAQAWEASADGPVVAAFAQTNAGDLSPNVPDATRGPTPDEVENTRVIGERQLRVAVELAGAAGTEVAGGLATRLSYVDLAGLLVGGDVTPDGRPHRTGRAVLGAAFAAGTKEGRGLPWCSEGVDGNPALYGLSRALYAVRPAVRAAQSPKAMLVPVGALGWVAGRVPVHLVRIGPLLLVGLAQEVTAVAGLRIRRAAAAALGMPLEDVLLQGYANDYAGYVTTPEEYDAQRYEGGHTMYGRWLLPAYVQEVSRVATDLHEGRPSVSAGTPVLPVPREAPAAEPAPGARTTGVPVPPLSSYAAGQEVLVEVAGPDPRGRAAARYVQVERHDGDGWVVVAADGQWAVRLRWRAEPDGAFVATVTWRVPAGTRGRHRMTWVERDGTLVPTPEFTVA